MAVDGGNEKSFIRCERCGGDAFDGATRSVSSTHVEHVCVEPRLRWPWLLSDRGILVVASIVAGIGAVGVVMMLTIAAGVSGSDRASLQIDAIKYGLGFVAAGGAAAALLLGIRRQQLSEYAHRLEIRKQEHSESDAADRRVTELVTNQVGRFGLI